MKKTLFITFLLCVQQIISAQKADYLKPARVIFYNAENLFDTINDRDINDEDFLPEGKLKWNTKKYQTKLSRLARVISTMLDTVQPLVIGLCEIENKKVLDDLIEQPVLKKFKFGIVHHNSPDERGIDCALLYNKSVVEPVFDATLPVNFPYETKDKTRDILYFKAFMGDEYSIYFFVNHWPSRRGGQEESEKKRIAASNALKAKIENLYLGEPYARVVIMGDFNDNPTDQSIIHLLTSDKKSKTQPLSNLMLPLFTNKEFTLKFGNETDVFDQFIVSKNLLDDKSKYMVHNSKAKIFSPEWLLFNHPKNGVIPNRTFANGRWTAGYSDHLPVYFDIMFK